MKITCRNITTNLSHETCQLLFNKVAVCNMYIHCAYILRYIWKIYNKDTTATTFCTKLICQLQKNIHCGRSLQEPPCLIPNCVDTANNTESFDSSKHHRKLVKKLTENKNVNNLLHVMCQENILQWEKIANGVNKIKKTKKVWHNQVMASAILYIQKS